VPHATPIKIPEPEFSQLHAAAQWLCAADRDLFLAAVADALAGQAIGPGSTCRAIALAFRTFYRPIEVGDHEANPLRKISYGGRKLEKQYDALEANRKRPPRRWT
jgi:hypothetical protein